MFGTLITQEMQKIGNGAIDKLKEEARKYVREKNDDAIKERLYKSKTDLDYEKNFVQRKNEATAFNRKKMQERMAAETKEEEERILNDVRPHMKRLFPSKDFRNSLLRMSPEYSKKIQEIKSYMDKLQREEEKDFDHSVEARRQMLASTQKRYNDLKKTTDEFLGRNEGELDFYEWQKKKQRARNE